MKKFCYSCSAPLETSEFKGPAEKYCKYCTDEKGNLKSREEIYEGITGWLKTWQPEIDEVTARERAANFMKAMPAWAEKCTDRLNSNKAEDEYRKT
jgi:hypothetical protein